MMKTGGLVLAVPELVALGLTKAEAASYQLLVIEGSATAYQLAKRLGFLPNAIYRLMRGLVKKKFVVELDTKPATFQPIPPSVALEAFSKHKVQNLEEQKIRALQMLSTKKPVSQTCINVLTGKNAMFSTYVALAKQAMKEILIISIGESVPDEIKLINRDALERGVAIKMIAHRYDKGNEKLLQSWVKMGIEVKHFPDWGFHLVVFDGQKSIFAVNNPNRTEERISLLIDNKGLSNALRMYFFSLWKKGKVIQ